MNIIKIVLQLEISFTTVELSIIFVNHTLICHKEHECTCHDLL